MKKSAVIIAAFFACLGAFPAAGAGQTAEEDFARGYIHYEKGEYEKALADFEAASRRRIYPEALFNLALAHWKLWQFDEARRSFTRVMTVVPHDELSVIAGNSMDQLRELSIHRDHLRAVNQYKRGEYEEARRNFESVIERKPDLVDAYFNLAILYWRQKNYESSRRYFETVMEMAPGTDLADQAEESIGIFLFEGYL